MRVRRRFRESVGVTGTTRHSIPQPPPATNLFSTAGIIGHSGTSSSPIPFPQGSIHTSMATCLSCGRQFTVGRTTHIATKNYCSSGCYRRELIRHRNDTSEPLCHNEDDFQYNVLMLPSYFKGIGVLSVENCTTLYQSLYVCRNCCFIFCRRK